MEISIRIWRVDKARHVHAILDYHKPGEVYRAPASRDQGQDARDRANGVSLPTPQWATLSPSFYTGGNRKDGPRFPGVPGYPATRTSTGRILCGCGRCRARSLSAGRVLEVRFFEMSVPSWFSLHSAAGSPLSRSCRGGERV